MGLLTWNVNSIDVTSLHSGFKNQNRNTRILRQSVHCINIVYAVKKEVRLAESPVLILPYHRLNSKVSGVEE